ncbi:MAG: uroporphyrinogen-III synthase [Planctomycetota bacterium]|jgi:uroporphyrinogen-III synthase
MPAILQGLVIVNTRPAQQQANLSTVLEVSGAVMLAVPAIEIVEAPVTDFHRNLSTSIAGFDIALFISRNAVDGAFRYFDADAIPGTLQLGVIGQGTGQRLIEKIKGRSLKLISAEPYNSEGLLAALQGQSLQGKRIIIFRGQPGRNLLGDELSAAGAKLHYCEVYRRVVPAGLESNYLGQVSRHPPNLILFTSNEGMQYLVSSLAGEQRNLIKRIPWLLISDRMRESALKLGHNAEILIAKSPGDSGIQQSICDWANGQKKNEQR